MGTRLAVILGAGASYDCASIGVTSIDHNYRPPLTSGIFEGRRPFQTILEKYPKARTLASTIAVRVTRGEPLEAVLRGLRNSKEEHIIRQFWQIPLYLQELFGEISFNYTSEAENYSYLANRLLGSEFEKVAFVTLNYDLLLEKSVGTITSNSGIQWKPKELSFYVELNRKWMLIKLHGSVNWGRVLVTRRRMGGWTHEGMLDHFDALALSLERSLVRDITVLSSHQDRSIQTGGTHNLCYPAISVPVEGKYEFVCPKEHVDAAKDFLSSCHNFLIIGASGKDKDLLELLRDNIKKTDVVGFVEASQDAVQEVEDRFLAEVPQFRTQRLPLQYIEGFGGFIRNKGRSLDDFVDVLGD